MTMMIDVLIDLYKKRDKYEEFSKNKDAHKFVESHRSVYEKIELDIQEEFMGRKLTRIDIIYMGTPLTLGILLPSVLYPSP